MKISQVAAQLYSIRDFIKTPPDIASSMKKIRSIGYQAVQVSGMGAIDEKELKKILDAEGLVCCATHEPSNTILNELQKVVARLQKLDCMYTAYPYPGGIDFSSPDAVKDLARKLDLSGKILADAGLVLTYHNHSVEFRHIEGMPAMQVIYDMTGQRNLQGEIDTYWVQAGGASPAEWCRKLHNRLPLLHLKDAGVNSQNQSVMTEIGSGNINWKEVVGAAEKSGTKWFIVEQDNDWIHNDPFESLEISYKYLRDTICD